MENRIVRGHGDTKYQRIYNVGHIPAATSSAMCPCSISDNKESATVTNSRKSTPIQPLPKNYYLYLFISKVLIYIICKVSAGWFAVMPKCTYNQNANTVYAHSYVIKRKIIFLLLLCISFFSIFLNFCFCNSTHSLRNINTIFFLIFHILNIYVHFSILGCWKTKA